VSDPRIIARATAAGTRRLRAVEAPLEELAPTRVASGAPIAAPPGGEGRTLSGLNGFLENARRQGAEIVAVAREQAEAIAANAREQGFAAGYAAGVAQAEHASAALLAQADAAAREVTRHRDEALAASERELVELALGIAEKVLQKSFEVEPDRVVDVLRGALRKTFVRDGLTVLCHPDDLTRLRASGPELQATLGGLQDLELLADRRINPGGVVVRTPTGDIDATIASQLDRLAAVLFDGEGGA
jgi:flagellar assembly protein FliH